jgi:protein-tyrosine phosphatase
MKVLFVCLGNICRSPLAEAVFTQLVAQRGLADRIDIDSAGTGGWHAGELADRRARAAGDAHGFPIHHRARQLKSADFEAFDLLIGMDEANVRDLQRWPGAEPSKVSLMRDWSGGDSGLEVPDPYYGDASDFDLVIELLVPACEGLLDHIEAQLRQSA